MVTNFLTNFYAFYRPDFRIRQNQRFAIKNDPNKSLIPRKHANGIYANILPF